jgi:NodT family efflux transporter outer membrane factor (OMF) lipoprotein
MGTKQRCLFAMKSLRGLLVLFVACGGCMVGPNYEPPPVQVADEWLDLEDPRVNSDQADIGEWWTVFDDPVLAGIIQNSYEQNLSLRAAGIRIATARYQKAVVVGNLFPQLQQGRGAYSHIQTSRAGSPAGEPKVPVQPDVVTGFLAAEAVLQPSLSAALKALPPNVPPRNFDFWQLGFDVAWELDVWGRFRRAIEAADASLDASIQNYDDVLVTLLAEVASTYVEVRTLQARLKLARENIKIQTEGLEIATAEFEGGAVSELDVVQAKALLAETQALVPALEAQLRVAENSLFTLMGMPPQDATAFLGDGEIPTAPPEVSLGIPADLLRRRPDVQRAERQIAAQSAFIGVAVSDLYPHFTLNGSLGLAANRSFSDLFMGEAFEYNFGPSFRWDLFNYGRLINNVRVQDAEFEALTADYENTVLVAAAEAENSIYAFLKSQDEARRLGKAVAASKRATEISLVQYQQGAVDYQRVLLAQQSLTAQQDTYASVQGSIAQNLIATYKALGGGWRSRLGKPFFPDSVRTAMEARTAWREVLTPWEIEAQGAEYYEAERETMPEGIQLIRPGPYARPGEGDGE